MTTATRLIFGIRTSGTVSLSVTANGQLPQQPPDLRIKTSEKDIAVPYSNNTWVTTLDAGDYIAYMPAPGDSWFDAPLTFTLSAAATLVSYTGTPKVLQTWTATSVTISDSKNPWPPPLASNVDTALLANSAWLSSTLTTMMAQVTIERSAPASAPPAGTPGPGRLR